MNEQTDLENYRVEGLNKYDTCFSVPLYSHITETLWVSGCPEDIAPKQFDFIVNLYPWGKYEIHEHQVLTTATLFDSEVIPNEKMLYTLANLVNVARSRGRTLVHCQAGLNRAPLVAGLAMIEDGMKPAAAIALLRAKRSPLVLCNRTFERWLLERNQKRTST